jgi:hypothetical protein
VVNTERHAVDGAPFRPQPGHPGFRPTGGRRRLSAVNTVLLDAADRIDDAAAVLRARAALIGLHVATTRWRSPAARVYFTRLDDITAGLTGCAARVTDLAELARRQALHKR